jgi:hypothetical protein
MQKLLKDSGIPEGYPGKRSEVPEKEEPQESMFLGLNAMESAEENEETQMWFSESSRFMDWLIEDEDMQCH